MSSRRSVRVRIFYQTDPAGTVAGGIDTFIRGILRWVPPDIEMSVVGVTFDPLARPPGKWTECSIGRRSFRFFPVHAVADASRQSRIPLSLSYTLAMVRHFSQVRGGFDVMDFHRIEPAALFLADARPRNAFFHQNMQVLHDPKADIRWKHFPPLYFMLERMIVPRFARVYCVKEDAVTAYRSRYPARAERFQFIPTWMDPEIYAPASPEERNVLRSRLQAAFGIPRDVKVIVTVGRHDPQKDPGLLVRAFGEVSQRRPDVHLLLIGDGVLREDLEARVAGLRLQGKVTFAGLRPTSQVADLLRSADLFALSSAYEGMPMSLLEAMGCGIPVVSTDVGEVRRVIRPGVNGEIASARSEAELASALSSCLDRLPMYTGRPALEAVSRYVPEIVLAPVFENYRKLATGAE